MLFKIIQFGSILMCFHLLFASALMTLSSLKQNVIDAVKATEIARAKAFLHSTLVTATLWGWADAKENVSIDVSTLNEPLKI